MLRRIVLGAAMVALVTAGVAACAPDNPKPSSATSSTSSTEPPLNAQPPSTAPPPATVSITTTIPPQK